MIGAAGMQGLASGPGSATPNKLSAVVYEGLLSRISAGDYPEGSKLPAESELSELFDVSRPVVREALARLRDDGVVTSRRGSGTYVSRAPSRAVLNLAPLSSIADMQRCFEFRVSLEGEAAFHAARCEDRHHREHLTQALHELDRVMKTGALGTIEDFKFHLAIAQATGNRFFETVMSSLEDSISRGIGITRTLSLMRPQERLLAVQREHLEVYDAIMAHDADRARQAMRTHLENARRRVFEGVDR